MKPKKKILFTIQWFGIPSKYAASANALCDELIIRRLSELDDIEIHILCYGLTGFPSEDIMDGIIVHRFNRSKFWNKYIINRNDISSKTKNFFNFINRIAMRFKQILFISSFPNYEPILVHKFESESLRLHRRYNFDAVISEFNGVDSLSAGLAIKRYDSNVKFLPICWDSIAGGRLANYMPRKFCMRQRRKLETQTMSLADKAIVMKSSAKFHKDNSSSFDYYNKYVILDIPYLNISHKELNYAIYNNISYNRVLKMLYSGTMSDRNPESLLAILEKSNIRTKLTFITLQYEHQKILSLQNKYPNVNIECLPYMSHDELTKYQRDCDILVNFGVSNPNAVSGKIFDYMRLGKPIISTVNHDNEASTPFLKKYSHALIIDERLPIEQNLLYFREFIDYVNNNPVDMVKVAEDFKENTPEAYIAVISNILYNKL